MNQTLGFEVHLNASYEDALKQVEAALKTEGFGILTRIDVRGTLKEKLGEEFRTYAIGGMNEDPVLKEVAADARRKLMRVVESLRSPKQ